MKIIIKKVVITALFLCSTSINRADITVKNTAQYVLKVSALGTLTKKGETVSQEYTIQPYDRAITIAPGQSYLFQDQHGRNEILIIDQIVVENVELPKAPGEEESTTAAKPATAARA